MKKILIAYMSETGNTKRVAEAIADEAKETGHDVTLAPVREVTADQFSSYDLVLVGSTCHSSDLAEPVKVLLNGIPAGDGPKLAGFVTHATWSASEDPVHREMHEKWAGGCSKTFERVAREKGLSFEGYFNCMGAPNPGIEEFIHNTIIPDEAQWAEYIEEVRRHPTEEDLTDARTFAREILSKL